MLLQLRGGAAQGLVSGASWAGWMFPAGVIASAILGTLSLKRNSGRALGITGLALAVLSVGAFFALVALVEY